jgi:hypothetical protein
VGAALERVPAALWLVLALGVLLRCLIALAVSPASMNNADSQVYAGGAVLGMFEDPVRPSGYILFLRGLHVFSDEISWTIFAQHVLGLATAGLLYAAVRRVGTPVWAGVVAAAAVLLSLDQIYLEHSILAEPLFTFLITATVYCCIRSLDDPRQLVGRVDTRLAWIAAAGLLLGAAAWVRAVGVPVAFLLAVWVALAIPGGWWGRIGRGALAGVAAGLVILGYFVAHDAANGYFGLTNGSGRVLLGRVSPFADCSKFDVPQGAERLCPTEPRDERPGADYYIWDANSPAWRALGPLDAEPEGDELAREFATKAILAQPLDYAGAVANDTLRHFVPYLNDDRISAGTPYDSMKIDRRDVVEADVLRFIDGYYDTGPLVVRGIAGPLGDLQDVLRVHQILMLQALVLSGFGLWFSSGRVRAALALFVGAGVMMLVIPSITATYNARYAVPLGGVFMAATAISIWALLERYKARVLGSSPDRADPA